MKSLHRQILFAIWACLIMTSCAFLSSAHAEDSPKTASNTPPHVDKLIQLQRKGCAFYIQIGDAPIYISTKMMKLSFATKNNGERIYEKRCYTDLNPHPFKAYSVLFWPQDTFPEYMQSKLSNRPPIALRIEVSSPEPPYLKDTFERHFKSSNNYNQDLSFSELPSAHGFYIYKPADFKTFYFATDQNKKTAHGNPVTFYCAGYKEQCTTAYIYKKAVFKITINNTTFVPPEKFLHFYDLFVSYIHDIIIDENAPLVPQMLRIEEMQNQK